MMPQEKKDSFDYFKTFQIQSIISQVWTLYCKV